jgi:hypothetical protein
MADPGHFGEPVRVTHARRIDDDREIISYAVLDMTPALLREILARTATSERAAPPRR